MPPWLHQLACCFNVVHYNLKACRLAMKSWLLCPGSFNSFISPCPVRLASSQRSVSQFLLVPRSQAPSGAATLQRSSHPAVKCSKLSSLNVDLSCRLLCCNTVQPSSFKDCPFVVYSRHCRLCIFCHPTVSQDAHIVSAWFLWHVFVLQRKWKQHCVPSTIVKSHARNVASASPWTLTKHILLHIFPLRTGVTAALT